MNNKDMFPDSLEELLKSEDGATLRKYPAVLVSPFATDRTVPSYRIVPKLTEAAESDVALVIETTVHPDGRVAVFYVSGYSELIAASKR